MATTGPASAPTAPAARPPTTAVRGRTASAFGARVLVLITAHNESVVLSRWIIVKNADVACGDVRFDSCYGGVGLFLGVKSPCDDSFYCILLLPGITRTGDCRSVATEDLPNLDYPAKACAVQFASSQSKETGSRICFDDTTAGCRLVSAVLLACSERLQSGAN
jgi:hypothetical protein